MDAQAINDDMFIKEKLDGKIYLMARPPEEHTDVQYNIANIFNDYFRKNKKKCIARIEAQLDIDNDNYVVPDVMAFCYETNKNIPMVVVEILSKWTRNADLGVKMKKYAAIGIKEYWIVDWMYCIIDIYVLNDDKKYIKYESYTHYRNEDFSKISKIREEQKADIEMTKGFHALSFPEMEISLEDVFYFVDR
ncbi:MAG: Uma2 family endonuclease [Oscillospiraceae bacterium]|nr:Uma2 family endonuclease [Oscillospiraceae bacterium]